MIRNPFLYCCPELELILHRIKDVLLDKSLTDDNKIYPPQRFRIKGAMLATVNVAMLKHGLNIYNTIISLSKGSAGQNSLCKLYCAIFKDMVY